MNTVQKEDGEYWWKKLADRFYQYMNNIKLSRKLMILYVFCVLLPLVVTDSVVLYIVLNAENAKQQHAMENEASAIQYLSLIHI